MDDIEAYRSFVKRKLNKYSFVSDASVSLLLSISKIQYFKKGQLLLQIGNISRKQYLLYEGAIVSYFISNDGSQYHKNIFLAGDFVGSTVSALINQASDFGLEAIEDATLIGFDYRQFRQLIDAHIDLKNFYISYLEKNWVIEKEKREIDIVLKNADERYLEFITAHPKIEERIPLHYIASHLGITPTQLSRIRKKIQKKQ
ncbi:MAG: Crp/Fnr family transcriptional regulator [Bacteroidota bacterium]